MNKYEITYLTAHEETANAESVGETLSKHGASIVSVNNWTGRRKLAYPIKKQDQAFYTTVVFESEPSALAPINKELSTNEGVLRFLMVHYIAQPERHEMPEPTMKATEEVKVESPVEETKVEPTVETPVTEEEIKPKRRTTKKATEEETKALDETLDKLLSEDITK